MPRGVSWALTFPGRAAGDLAAALRPFPPVLEGPFPPTSLPSPVLNAGEKGRGRRKGAKLKEQNEK